MCPKAEREDDGTLQTQLLRPSHLQFPGWRSLCDINVRNARAFGNYFGGSRPAGAGQGSAVSAHRWSLMLDPYRGDLKGGLNDVTKQHQ